MPLAQLIAKVLCTFMFDSCLKNALLSDRMNLPRMLPRHQPNHILFKQMSPKQATKANKQFNNIIKKIFGKTT